MKPKKLEWKICNDDKNSYYEITCNRYLIELRSDNRYYFFINYYRSFKSDFDIFISLREAKKAAQKHFDNFVMGLME